jgi:hypothetical protein
MGEKSARAGEAFRTRSRTVGENFSNPRLLSQHDFHKSRLKRDSNPVSVPFQTGLKPGYGGFQLSPHTDLLCSLPKRNKAVAFEARRLE